MSPKLSRRQSILVRSERWESTAAVKTRSPTIVVRNSSVFGTRFWLGGVTALVSADAVADVRATLEGLVQREVIMPQPASRFRGDEEYAFRHLLVREVAYGQIPRAARADKHRAAADWVEALGRPDDHAEMLASHYSRALEYARAAGVQDAELSERGRLALRDAGDRAASLSAWPAAARFYAEALDLWPEDDPELPDLHFRCGRVRFMLWLGKTGPASPL